MDWSQIAIGAVNLLVVGVLVPLSRSVAKMRHNELTHLQESLDRIEKRLDEHLTYHLEHKL